ncbi:MAG: response regulator transcription factor [Oscillospiraceae bacterium]|jgi:DNA-binding NarL/FixJ family response regulator|nr:response regulator transcription factor [Oscillospiraceae bacterium]
MVSKSIVLVDDHTLFRNGLKTLISTFGDYEVVAEASNGVEFLEILDYIIPDIVLLDISMPVMDGLTAISLALEKQPKLKIIVLSMYGEEEYYHKMSNVGAKGFLLKDSTIDEVQAALDTVYQGKHYFSQELLMNIVSTRQLANNESFSIELSEREQEILILISRGMSNNDIADTLFISKRTVEKHRANLLEKTGCNNTATLVIWAIRNKIVKL